MPNAVHSAAQRTQRDALPLLRQPDDVGPLHDGLPVEAVADLGEQLPDLVVVKPLLGGHRVPQLLVLGADPEAQQRAVECKA